MTASTSSSPSPASGGLQRITARSADIGGGIAVQRVLPTRQRRSIGAWCFLDHAGPAHFEPGGGMRVAPHPHIGLQTFTWMIAGEVLHRDSLGNEQRIRPGEVNLMTAGHGISHTEESLDDERQLHAAQLWIALPPEAADCAPAFDHHPELPRWDEAGCAFTLLAGEWGGRRAPARLYSPLVALDLHAPAASTLTLALQPDFEYGVLVLEGEARLGGEHFAKDELAFSPAGARTLELQLGAGTRAILIGGEPRQGEIVIWWNFVGHDRESVARACADWERERAAGGGERFGRVEGFDGEALAAPPVPWA